MLTTRAFLIAVALSATLLPISEAAPGKLALGVVADQADFHDGGCELFFATERDRDAYAHDKYIFMSDFQKNAAMNINGRDVKLTLARSTESQWRNKVGTHTRYWYTAGMISVNVDYTLTRRCPPEDESCEVFYYNATIHVIAGALQRTVFARGLCGT